jgi:hypothetical protein
MQKSQGGKSMTSKEIYSAIAAELDARKDRSAYARGVTMYARELLDELDENGRLESGLKHQELARLMLNGADSWTHYSYSACSLVFDGDIAERLCTPSELKRKRDGELQPGGGETWLDVQARALARAAGIIKQAYRHTQGVSR